MADQIVQKLDEMYEAIGLQVVCPANALYVFHYIVELRPYRHIVDLLF